ncbi:MAG: nitroreductase family protein [Bacteroidales bacterium]|nr:nitroreductase family protein [Bacteroidales bacterium]
MKKSVLFIAALLLCAGLSAQNTVKLPSPKKDAGMTLYQALQQRASVRQFKTDAIPEQKLSDLLWAACGINREDGRLTAPTAINSQDIRLYVCRKEGAYEYIAKDNALVKVSGKDLRQDVAAGQGTVGEAPMFLVLVADLNRYNRPGPRTATFGAIDCGYVSQNICLACEALGLSTVPRAIMNQDVLKKELGLKEGMELLINHPVGYKK